MKFPRLSSFAGMLKQALGGGLPQVTEVKAAAVSTALTQDGTIEKPQLSDFEALEPGDLILSSRPGSQREVLSHDKEEKEITVKTTRNTLVSGLYLKPMYRANEVIPISPEELVTLPVDTVVYLKKGPGKYVPVTLHFARLGEGKVDGVQITQGEYSLEETLSYGDPDFSKVATKIIKKPKQ